MWVFSTIVVVVRQESFAPTTTAGSAVSIFILYVSDHCVGSGYAGKKEASYSLVPL